MRILFLAWRDLAHPSAGGSEVLVDELASGLHERGHDVTLIAAGPLSPHPYRAVEASGRLRQYLTDPFLAHHLGLQDVVVDVCNGVPFFSPLWTSAPVVLLVNHIHFGMWREWFSPPVSLLGSTIETKVMPRLYRNRRIVAVSESTAKALTGLGVPNTRISIVHNGVDVSSVGHRTTPRAGEPTFLALGRLVPHKRFDLLLRAWAHVHPEVGGRLVIAGDGPLRERLQANLPPGAELLGWVSEAHKRELMEQAWLLVQPSRLEGWGLVVMEAAAAGTPTLGFWAPGTRDAVEHQSSGILVRTERELVEAWISLAQDAEQRRVLSKGAEERAMGFSWTGSVDAFQQVLLEAAGNAVASAPEAVSRTMAVEAPPQKPFPLDVEEDKLESLRRSRREHHRAPFHLRQDHPIPIEAGAARALARCGLRRVRRALGDNPVFLPVVLRATPLGTSRRITPETELVIEGYPRSGNTFAHFAVLHAEPGAVITSRVHTPSQVKRAVAQGTPTLLTIRGPIDVITSTLLAAPHVPIRSLLEEYIHHYEILYPYLDRVLVATFEEITSDFDSVIDALNERFSLGFRPFGHTPENTAAVFAAIEEHHREHWGADRAGLPVPSEVRRPLKELVRREVQRPEYAALLFEAQTVHDTVAARSITALAPVSRD